MLGELGFLFSSVPVSLTEKISTFKYWQCVGCLLHETTIKDIFFKSKCLRQILILRVSLRTRQKHGTRKRKISVPYLTPPTSPLTIFTEPVWGKVWGSKMGCKRITCLLWLGYISTSFPSVTSLFLPLLRWLPLPLAFSLTCVLQPFL